MKNFPKLMDCLSDNVKNLMGSHDTLRTDEALGSKSGAGRSTVQRIRVKEGTTTLDTVDKIAAAFNVPAADLLSVGGKARPNSRNSSIEDIIELLKLFDQATEAGRNQILVMAHRAEKRNSSIILIPQPHSASDQP